MCFCFNSMNLQYLILFVCFVGVIHNCYADDDKSLSEKILSYSNDIELEKQVIPDCYFGIETISIILFTREDRNGISLTIQNLTTSDLFRKSHIKQQIIFLIHGFVSSANNSNYENLTEVLLEKGDYIIISVNWKEGSCNDGLSILKYAGYYYAVEHTPEVGVYVANFTKILVEHYGMSMTNIQIIGHSLGAHVAGFAGKEVQKLNIGKYNLITGLDPAGVLFSERKCSERLCHTDAEYVQVLHTTILLGTKKRLGNIDFYINGGSLQPNCELDVSCSHSISVQYLTQCLRYKCCLIGIPWDYYNKQIPLSKCTKETCVCIGLNTENYPADGSFYVPVEAKFPYCHNEGVKL